MSDAEPQGLRDSPDIGPDEDVDKLIGANLVIARGDRSQKELAELMRAKGFKWSQATVWAVEKGERPLRLAEALQLESILRMNVHRWTRRPKLNEIEDLLRTQVLAWQDSRQAMLNAQVDAAAHRKAAEESRVGLLRTLETRVDRRLLDDQLAEWVDHISAWAAIPMRETFSTVQALVDEADRADRIHKATLRADRQRVWEAFRKIERERTNGEHPEAP